MKAVATYIRTYVQCCVHDPLVYQFRCLGFMIRHWDTVEPPNSGHHPFVLCREVVLFQRLNYFVQSVYTRVQMVCPLLGGLSSFGVSFIGCFTVFPVIF